MVWTLPPIALGAALAFSPKAAALEFEMRQVANTALVNRDPAISEDGTLIWVSYNSNDVASAITDITRFKAGELQSLAGDSAAIFYGNVTPVIQSNHIAWTANYRNFGDPNWVLREGPARDEGAQEISALYKAFVGSGGEQIFVNIADSTNGIVIWTNGTQVITNTLPGGPITNDIRRHPSGDNEINYWPGTGDIVRVTVDRRNDFAPSVWGGMVAWQKAKGWPFGWEIMFWETNQISQLTTNFYYDLGPKVHNNKVVWYGWDGYDFEIFLYDRASDTTTQITSNRFDDMSPVIWDDVIAWEGYPAVESDIYMWKNGQVTKISENVEDDFHPRIWNGQVVWQGFDGDDFEIYLYDGSKSVKLTANNFDDVNPEIHDGLVVWMGYEGNWDAEIFAWDGRGDPARLTENEVEDRDPHTAGRRIVWAVESEGQYQIWLAEPR